MKLKGAGREWTPAGMSNPSALLAPATLFQLLHHLIEVEAGGLLSLRVLFERPEELADEVLRRD